MVRLAPSALHCPQVAVSQEHLLEGRTRGGGDSWSRVQRSSFLRPGCAPVGAAGEETEGLALVAAEFRVNDDREVVAAGFGVSTGEGLEGRGRDGLTALQNS